MPDSATTDCLPRLLSPDGWTVRRAFLAALAAAVLVSFTGVFDHSLWRPDEPRVAGIGYEMMMHGDYVVPRILGEPFLEKPPLYWWGMTALYRLFGVSDGVARMTSALAAVATLMLVFDLCRRLADPFAGLMASVVVGATAAFYDVFHSVLVDTWLALFVLFGYWAFVFAESGRAERNGNGTGRPRWLGVLLLYAACGLAFLCKGLVGPTLICGPVGLAILAGRRWRFLRSWAHAPGVLVFGGLCALWPVLLYEHGGRTLLEGFLVNNLLYRIHPTGHASYTGGHVKPFWYYLKGSCIAAILPWAVALPALVLWLWKRRTPAGWNWRGIVFIALILPAGVFILSIPETKRQLYVTPLQTPMAAALGLWLAAQARQGATGRIDRLTQFLLVGVPALGAALLIPAGVGALALSRCDLPSMAISGRDVPSIMRVLPAWLYIVASVLGLAFLPAALYGVRLWRRNSRGAMVVAAWLALGVFSIVGPLAFIAREPFESLRPLTAGLVEDEAFSPKLIVYCLDEVGQSLIPLETGEWPKASTNEAALRGVSGAGPGRESAPDKSHGAAVARGYPIPHEPGSGLAAQRPTHV